MTALRGGFGEGRFGLCIPTSAPCAWGPPEPCCHGWGSAGDASLARWHRSPSVPAPLLPEHPWSPGRPAPACAGGPGSAVLPQGLGGLAGSWQERARVRTHGGEKLEVKCLKVRPLFSMNLLYLILSTNSNLIASGLKPLQ